MRSRISFRNKPRWNRTKLELPSGMVLKSSVCKARCSARSPGLEFTDWLRLSESIRNV